VQQSSTSTYIPNFIQIEETFCGRTDGRTDGRTGGRTFFPSILLGRLSEVDLIIWTKNIPLSWKQIICVCLVFYALYISYLLSLQKRTTKLKQTSHLHV